MYRVLGLLGAVLLSFPSWAAEPDDESYSVGFNVAGGHFEKWSLDTFFPKENEDPTDLYLILTGTNSDEKWGSNLAFFFGTREGTENGEGRAPENAVQEIRLRFVWEADKHAFFPLLNVYAAGDERKLARMDMPIGLNEPVSLSVGKVEDGGRSLIINGKKAPVRLGPKLDRCSILVSGVKGAISTSRTLLSSPSRAVEPAGKFHFTTAFKVEGGYFDMWTMDDYLANTGTGPIDMRFVLTGRNRSVKWASNIAFFFAGGTGADDGQGTAPEEPLKEIRLHFSWDVRGFFPRFYAYSSNQEEKLNRMDMRIRMNEPVSLSIRKNEEGGRSLFINGKEAPVRLDPRLNRLSIVVSGVEGTITMPSF